MADAGAGFLDAVVAQLAAQLKASHAFAAVREESEAGRLTVVASCGEGIMAEHLTFRTAGSPCECVLQLGPRSYPSSLSESFPEDLLLRSMGIESFVGTWLRDGAGQPYGVLAVMDRAPMPHAHLTAALLDAVAPRVAAEIGRLRADAGRRRAEETLAHVYAACSDAITISSITDGRYLDVSDGFTRLFGYGRAQAIGRTATELGIWRTPAARRALVASLAAEGTLRDREVELVSRDGIVKTCLISADVIEIDGRACMLAVTRDVTEWHRAAAERARLAEQVRQAQNMEAIGKLAGSIAHDFNNILQLLEAHLSVATEHLPADSAAAATALSAATKTVARGAGLARQLLTFSGRQAGSIAALDLARELGDLASLMHGVIGDDIVLAVSAEPHLPAVRLDRTQLEQIVLNLCMNARDAMPSGGRIGIDATRVHITPGLCAAHASGREGAYVCLAVADSGSGMPPDVLQHIFEPFFTTKETGRGTGLGLPTVYGIVQRAGGFLHVDSEIGVGTCVRVYLPVTSTPAAPRAEVRTSGSDRRSGNTILVVEAELAVRNLVATCLERKGYRVLAAANGGEALSHLEANREDIALAVLDAAVPRLGGAALCHLVRRVLPDLPIIFTTGYTDHPLAGEPAPEGRHTALFKPYLASELLRLIGGLLQGARRAAEPAAARLLDDPRR